ncbi:hypothetical protein [Gracilimonas sp. BCB1]|uniref:hypothetical protein n=1 Tax=Gracilimonas sp. BCB1 TaxID=3152362 RepID=UPI0032D955A2
MKSLFKYWVLIALLMTTSCTDEDKLKEKYTRQVLEMHDAQREYHFEKMSAAFAGQLSEDFISVNRGELSQMSYEEHKARYDQYFSAVEFEYWDDTREPLIRFSDDYSLAYTIVEKDVILNYQDENGTMLRDSVHYAWLAVYRKQDNGEWKIESVASTNSEPVVEEIR